MSPESRARRRGSTQAGGRTPLNRALSKLGILSRAQATRAIREGRVAIDGVVACDPLAPVVPERVRITVDGAVQRKRAWRTIVFYKPRGVVTTRRDPDGRKTIYDVLGPEASGLVPVGRLDRASSGLLLLTTDTQLAHRIADPAMEVVRVYLVTVRGMVAASDLAAMERGISSRGETLRAARVALRKASRRESHIVVELREGKNREVRRLCEAIGHEVTSLKRIAVGGLTLGPLEPGEWRELSRADVDRAFPPRRPGG